MRLILLLILAFSGPFAFAQSFEERFLEPPMESIYISSVAFADIDGDEDQDVLLIGEDRSSNLIAKLYRNDGAGNFTEDPNTPFTGVNTGSVAFADVDGDEDQDVLITGRTATGRIASLFINDGLGNFTEIAETPFEGVLASAVAFADVDGDEDQDLLITGQVSLDQNIANLYLNDGAGNFTEDASAPFQGIDGGTVEFVDVDGDEDADVLIIGTDNGTVANLYINDGVGNFTLKSDTPFEGVSNSGSFAFADIDGDEDNDLVITGNGLMGPIAKLYINDGSGGFTEVPNPALEAVEFSSIAFADVDNDEDQDLIITGVNLEPETLAILYLNDGDGNFTEVMDMPFEGVFNGAVAFADVDNDGDDDFLLTGQSGLVGPTTRLYINNTISTSVFSPDKPTNLQLYTIEDQLYINYVGHTNGKVQMHVFGRDGRLISRYTQAIGLGNPSIQLDISDLPKGMYMLLIQNGKTQGSGKFMVK